MALVLTSLSLSAQDDANTGKKISYNMINEYGCFFGGGSWGSNIGFEGTFVNSILFNRTQDLLGIGLGYSIDLSAGHGIPIFLNYRHYFDRGRALKPLVNIAVGTTFIFGFLYADEPSYYNGYNYPDCESKDTGFGLYATIASGFRVKAFSFAAGFYLRSAPVLNYITTENGYSCKWDRAYNGGIQIKVGYTF